MTYFYSELNFTTSGLGESHFCTQDELGVVLFSREVQTSHTMEIFRLYRVDKKGSVFTIHIYSSLVCPDFVNLIKNISCYCNIPFEDVQLSVVFDKQEEVKS